MICFDFVFWREPVGYAVKKTGKICYMIISFVEVLTEESFFPIFGKYFTIPLIN